MSQRELEEFLSLEVYEAWLRGKSAVLDETPFPKLVVGAGARAVFFMVSFDEGYSLSYGRGGIEPGTKIHSIAGTYLYRDEEMLAKAKKQWLKAKRQKKAFKPDVLEFSEKTNIILASTQNLPEAVIEF